MKRFKTLKVKKPKNEVEEPGNIFDLME